MSPRAWFLPSVVTLALAVAACSANDPGRPAGFSIAYAPAGYDAAAANVDAGPADSGDGGAPDADEGDGGVSDAGPSVGAPILRAIAGSGAGSAWAVGDDGAAVRLTGNTFTAIDTGLGVSLGGLTVLDVAHAYAVERGGPRVFAWAGQRWAAMGEPRADRAGGATWAASSKDVWAAGDGIDRWTGTAWTQQVPNGAAFRSMAGSFDTDVWAVGPGGAQHWDGTAWSAAPVPPGTPALAAVWVGGLYDAWVVGAAGTVLHWAGSTFTQLVTPTTKDLTAITGTGTFDIWIGGRDGLILHWDGNDWSQFTSPARRTIQSIWTSYGGDVFFVDGAPTISRYAR
jgi:hypothetical protein